MAVVRHPLIRVDECSLADLQPDGDGAQRTSWLRCLGSHSVHECGLAIELMEFIQV